MLSVHVIGAASSSRRHRPTFRFHSTTFERMYGFHSNFAELYTTIKYRSDLILVIIGQILAVLWPFFDLVFVVCFCSINFEGMHWFYSNFAELYININYRSSWILVIISQIFTELWPFFRLRSCWCVDIGFRSITFAGMLWFYWKFAEGYIIVKYRSGSILVIIRKILAKLWPFFNLIFVGVLILVSVQ